MTTTIRCAARAVATRAAPRAAELLLAALGTLGTLAASASHAGALTLHLTDSAGKPLADAVALLEPAGAKAPTRPMADVDIAQAKREFTPRVTLITVGTRALFPNFDTVRHHVYSFSPAKTFELKLYAGVPNVPVVFDKPGMAVLGCNIHDSMAAWVLVVDSPLHARSSADGKARIAAVPPGAYRLRVWHPGQPANVEPAPVQISVAEADADPAVRLNVTLNPLAALP